MNAPDEFEATLRGGLATLAREAVPGASGEPATLPPMREMPARRDRRLGPRLLAAGVAITVVTASVVVAVSTHGGKNDKPLLPPTSVWTKIAPFYLQPRSHQAAVWTGREVIVWGGRNDESGGVATPALPGHPPYHTLDNGLAYDVSADRWNQLASAPIGARYDAVSAWTGSEMLVVGGVRDGTGALRDGAAYDPARDRWRRIPDAPGCPSFGAWTGRELVVGGTCADVAGARPVFASYDPAANRWTTLPVVKATQLVAAGDHLYAWDPGTTRGFVFVPAARRWRVLRPISEVAPQDSQAVGNGDRLAVVGRRPDPRGNGPDVAFVAQLDPSGRSWTWESSAVSPPFGLSVVSSGDGAILWSSAASFGAETIDPEFRRFSQVNVGDAPIPLDRTGESIVSIGYRRFFIWGGRLAGTEKDPINRPTADGAIVEVRPLPM